MSSIARRLAALGGVFDSDVRAWYAAVLANGGAVSSGRLAIVNTFVRAEKASGAWALTDDYWCLWGETSTQALTSLKQRRLATAVNSPTFTADRNYAFDGATSYINTGFVPSTHAVAYSSTLQRIAVYERTNVTGTTSSMGAANTTTNRAFIQPRSASNMVVFLNNSATTANFTLPAADSRGLSAGSRNNSANTIAAWKNGVRLTDATGLTASTNIQTHALYIGGYNNAGSLATPRACSVGFAAIGAVLTDAQETAQYNAVQAFATSVGANV